MTRTRTCRAHSATLLRSPLLVLVLAALAAPWPALPGVAQEGRALSIEEYQRWRTIAGEAISADGTWVAWTYERVRRDDLLHVAEVDGDGEHVVSRASGAVFSPDGRWVAYRISPPVAEVERLEREGERVPRDAALLDLRSGEVRRWTDASGFAFSPCSRALLVEKAAGEAGNGDRDRGRDRILVHLERGTTELIADVTEHAFRPAGRLLAYTVGTGDREGNGLHLADLETGLRRTLDSRPEPYEGLVWDEAGSALAVLRGRTPEGRVRRENVLLTVTGTDGDAPERLVFDPEEAAGFPDGMVLSEFRDLAFNEDGTRVLVGIRPQEEVPREPEEGELRPDVHVFHWADDRIQTVQQRQADSDRRRTHLGSVHLPSLRFVRLGDEAVAGVEATRDARWAVGADDGPYVSDWKEPRADYFRIDGETGERVLIVEAQGRTLGLSPHSSHFLYWREGDVWAYDLAAGEAVNLTASAPDPFVDGEFDRTGTPPPYGVAGWTEDGEAVVLEHRHDLWLQPLDGSPATNLTGGFGEAHEIRFRVEHLDPEARTLDLSRPLLLRAFGTRTKRSGYFRLHPEDSEPRELVYEDRWYSRPAPARDGERLLFTRETFREFPDLHVSDGDFGGIRRITDANPQQAEYRWGERLLFEFEGPDGVTLQGTLAVPDGRDPGERLPMLVNFYEQNSHNLHRHQTPGHAHRPNFSGYVSRGYLVMQPDVRFRTRTTHTDMLESVEGAVREVIESGYADPDRVGLHGHSFSGGGAAYIAGRSDRFAAVVAGAAPINLRSEFNQLFRGTGRNNHSYDIHGQGRYGTDPYTDLELYLEQSPITHVPTLDTPMIYLHGEEDMVVEYLQGMELYNAARFLEKPVIFLSYPGEGHGLSRLENRLDFQIRIRQFYDHHLRDEPAPGWMTEGVPYLERRERGVVPRELLAPPER